MFVPPVAWLEPLRVEDFLLGVGLVAFSLVRRNGLSVPLIPGLPIVPLLAVMAISVTAGMLIGAWLLQVRIVPADVLILGQIAKYLLLVFVVLKSLEISGSVRHLVWYTAIYLTVVSLLAASQFWNFYNINAWLTPHYQTRTILLGRMTAAHGDFRVTGTMGNPNYFGLMVLWLGAWTYAAAINLKNSHLLWIASFISLCVMVPGVLLTQSRTVYVGAALALLATLFIGGKIREAKTPVIVLVAISLVVSVGYLGFLEGPLEERRFGQRLDWSSESRYTSGDARVRDSVEPLKFMITHPYLLPFGQGPSKDVLRTDSHNGYTWLAQRAGFVGLTAYIVLMCLSFQLGRRLYNDDAYTGDIRAVGMAVTLWVMVWAVGEATANVFKDPRIMSLTMLSLAMLAHSLRERRMLELGEGRRGQECREDLVETWEPGVIASHLQ